MDVWVEVIDSSSSEGGWPLVEMSIEQNGDNPGTIHVDLSLYADAVFAKQWI